MLCDATWRYVALGTVMRGYVVYVVLCGFMPCYVALCGVMWRHLALCGVLLRYVALRDVM